MANIALSLAAISYPSSAPLTRQSPRIREAIAWAKENNYEVALASVEPTSFSAGSPELTALGALSRQLDTGAITSGTVLILDDYGSISESEMQKAVTLLMHLINQGLSVVTLRDGKVWNAASLADIGGFLMSIMQDYANRPSAHPTQEAQEGE